MPARGRARDLLAGVPTGAAVQQRRDCAGGGDDAVGPRWPQRHHPGQLDAYSFGRKRRRVGRGHPAGPRAARRTRAIARRVPEFGEPRVANAVDLDQGLDGHRSGRRAGPRTGRDAAVLPGHRPASRPHARSDWRPARPRAHRDGHVVRVVRTGGSRRAGGSGAQHFPERRRQPAPEHRPGGGAPPSDGRPGTDRASSQQPPVERRKALPRIDPDPDRGRAGRRARGDLGNGRGSGRAGGPAPAPVPQARRRRRRRRAGWPRGVRPGPVHLQRTG